MSHRFIIIIIVVVVIIIIQAIRMSIKSGSHHFECTECGHKFHVNFVNYMFTAHGLDGKCSVTCPKCRKTNMLPPVSGKV